ncbi:hypothetical protein C8R43DRAFT_1027227 [Mycena crocata]|nr:hypothetical protein C8R43DRAFT_1027227 [Mycena crocata]
MKISAQEGAEKLAAHLGLTTTAFDLIPPQKYEVATAELRNISMEVSTPLNEEVEDCNDPVMSAFCARFLPSLILAYKKAPRPESPYALMLYWTTQNDYFSKLMRSPWGSDLYVFHVDQLLAHASSVRKRKTSSTNAIPTLQDLSMTSTLRTFAEDYKWNIFPLSEDQHARLESWVENAARTSADAINPSKSLTRIRIRPGSNNYNFHERIQQNCTILLDPPTNV